MGAFFICYPRRMARYGYTPGGAPDISPAQKAKLRAAREAENTRDALLSEAIELLKSYAFRGGAIPADVIAEIECLQAKARAIEIPSIY